jgi:hypothetical protein
MLAQIRYYYKIDPDNLSDDKIINLFAQLEWVRQEEAKTKTII